MSTEVITGIVVTEKDERLRQLAEDISREHQAAVQSMEDVIRHVVAAGEALIEAKTMIHPGEWGAWLENSMPLGLKRSACRNYMRLAYHKDQLDYALGVTANLKLVTGLPRRHAGTPRYPDEVKQRALELCEQGMGYPAVAAAVGTTTDTVHSWHDPEWGRERSQKISDARKERSRRAGTQKRQPDPLSYTYRYGEPGRAAITAAVRALARSSSRLAAIENLKVLIAICQAWQDKLEHSNSTVV